MGGEKQRRKVIKVGRGELRQGIGTGRRSNAEKGGGECWGMERGLV